MIESAELVLTALAAGTAAGMSETATTAVKDAYQALKALTGKALRRSRPESDQATVDSQLADPAAHHDELVAALTEAGIEAHPELIDAAQRVLDLVDPQYAAKSKYSVTVTDSTGVQVGDRNSMTIQAPK